MRIIGFNCLSVATSRGAIDSKSKLSLGLHFKFIEFSTRACIVGQGREASGPPTHECCFSRTEFLLAFGLWVASTEDNLPMRMIIRFTHISQSVANFWKKRQLENGCFFSFKLFELHTSCHKLRWKYGTIVKTFFNAQKKLNFI